MAQFQGRWEDDLSVPKIGFDEMMKKSGVPDEAIEKYKKSVSYFDYDVKGNKWRVKNGADVFPGKEMVYDFEIGKEFEGEMLDGSKFKSVVTVNSDNQITEKMNNDKWGEFTLTRTIEGNAMTVKENAKGMEMTYKMKKC